MAGTLPGIANTQRIDQQGKPLVGGRLYIFQAGTLTPATAYRDFNLTAGQELPFPMELDEWGQIPPFYLADGFYRARLTNASGGTVLFDVNQLPAVGNPEGGGGETPVTVDPTAIFQTGDEMWVRKSGARTGWVRANGRTIGNSLSGATERASADCQSLFEYYWNNFADALNPVVGGRGANASSDWAAGKQITLPNYKGKIPIGANQMGSGANGSNTDTSFATPDAVGSSGGASQVTITQSNLPNVTLSVTIPAGQGSHNHGYIRPSADPTGGSGFESSPAGFGKTYPGSLTDNSTLPQLTGSAPLGGSGTAINKTPPAIVLTCYIKL